MSKTMATLDVPTRRARTGSAGRATGTLALIVDSVVLTVAAVALVVHSGTDPALTAFLVGSLLLIATLDGSYRRPRLNPRLLGDARSAARTGAAPLLAAGLVFVVDTDQVAPMRATVWLVLALAAARALSGVVIVRLRRTGRLQHRVLVVGTGQVADEVIAGCERSRRHGMRIVDRLDGGRAIDMVESVERAAASVVIVAYSTQRDHELVEPLRALQRMPVEVLVVPRLFGFGGASGDARIETCGGVPLVWLPHHTWRREQRAVKRLFDLVVAAVMLVVAAPAMAVIALVVRLTSPGPAIFRQTRLGRDLQPFEMYKFRTMRHGIDPTESQSGGDSPHRTRVGTWLRRTSLDELPQLFNVIRGDMSIVGPRPEQPHFVMEFLDIPGYAERHRVPVGITGWAQVNELRGGSTSLRDRAAYDNFYIEHWSPWLDLEIVFRTVAALVRGS